MQAWPARSAPRRSRPLPGAGDRQPRAAQPMPGSDGQGAGYWHGRAPGEAASCARGGDGGVARVRGAPPIEPISSARPRRNGRRRDGPRPGTAPAAGQRQPAAAERRHRSDALAAGSRHARRGRPRQGTGIRTTGQVPLWEHRRRQAEARHSRVCRRSASGKDAGAPRSTSQVGSYVKPGPWLAAYARTHVGLVRASDWFSKISQETQNPGDDLFSRKAALSVSSALESLTSVFGMGTGVASPLESPGFSASGCVSAAGRRARTVPCAGRRLMRSPISEFCHGSIAIPATDPWSVAEEVKPSTVSTAQLHPSPDFDMRPIKQVVSLRSYPVDPVGNLISRRASHLDAFSAYPDRT
jgi:hypothetical protein